MNHKKRGAVRTSNVRPFLQVCNIAFRKPLKTPTGSIKIFATPYVFRCFLFDDVQNIKIGRWLIYQPEFGFLDLIFPP